MEELKVAASGPGELTLTGSLTVANAAAILKIIRETLAREDRLVIRVGEDAEVDVSFLQILCSAHRTAAELNKCLQLDTGETGKFYSAARAAGYVRTKGCSRDRDGSCLWAREGK
ncbi:MAG: STAS domain-containing protein [Nitrospiraceae bacterium]|nr:STAS domain-containing protein [Nitrospiraceae bacterium]